MHEWRRCGNGDFGSDSIKTLTSDVLVDMACGWIYYLHEYG